MHVNGFTQLHGSFDGLERDFDLGYKFEERESEQFLFDPHTGTKVFAEPVLRLYVSVSPQGSTEVPVTFQYTMTRSRFAHGLHATDEDRRILLQEAIPLIVAGLRSLLSQHLPESTK